MYLTDENKVVHIELYAGAKEKNIYICVNELKSLEFSLFFSLDCSLRKTVASFNKI